MDTATGIRTLVEATRAGASPARGVAAGQDRAAVCAALPAGTRPARPARRRDAPRPAGRRDAVELPPARWSVADRGRHGVVGTGMVGLTRGDDAVAGVLWGGRRPVAVPCRAVALRRRRVVASAVLAVVLAVLVVVAGALLGGGASPAAGPVPARVAVTVVGPGESLVEIARRTAPGADTAATVARIRSLNGLEGSVVVPGTPVRVPAA